MEKNFANISEDVLKAQQDKAFREKFIDAHRKFIISKTYNVIGRYINENDDEYSIALIAFNEAIDSYEESKGDFFALSSLIIKRRLLDYIKSEAKYKNEVLTDAFGGDIESTDEDNEMAFNIEVKAKEAELSKLSNSFNPESNSIQDEIGAVKIILEKYGFSFFDLVDCSPKSTKTKKACAEAVNYIIDNKEIFEKMRSGRLLPIKEILENVKIPRKLLERHRKYIIAAVEILDGEYPQIAEYMAYIRKG